MSRDYMPQKKKESPLALRHSGLRFDSWQRGLRRRARLFGLDDLFRLIEQLQAYQGEEVASYLFHAYGTNLQFGEGEFNFVKARAEHGTKKAFQLRDEHFEIPEP